MKVKFTSALFLLISCFAQAQHAIIPNPVSYIAEKGNFVVTPTTKVVLKNSNSELFQVADLFFSSFVIKGLKVVQSKPNANSKNIEISLNSIADESIGKEGYSLKVRQNKVELKANNVIGVFYALQSLDQLFDFNAKSNGNVVLPACTITDFPRFGWRGLMLDVSRHFFSTSDVKKYIDWMSKYKFNVLHWHLSDDNGWRIEIKALPKLTEIGAWRVERFGAFGNREAPSEGEATAYGGFYTQEEIKDILHYAAERQITIVPEIDIPGHSMALLAAYPELSTLKEPKMVNPGSSFADWHGDGTFTMKIENSLNPSDEKVYAILDTIFGEVAALFPGQYIHIGGDECYHGFWEKDPGCVALMQKENLKDAKELQSYFIKKVVNIITSKGKKAIGWDEILYGGLADGAAIMSWRGTKGGIEASKAGHEVVMSPNSFAYLDYTQGDPSVEVPVYAKLSLKKSYEFEPAPEGVDPKYILGGQGNLWTEKIPTIEHAFYMTYPRAFAIIESVWSPSEKKEWNNFSTRLETHFNRFETSGKPISKAVYDPIVSVKKQDGKMICTLSNDLADVAIFYTIDGTFPAQYSTKYNQPFEIPKGDITFRAVCYRNGKPIGRTLTISKEMLEKRIGK